MAGGGHGVMGGGGAWGFVPAIGLLVMLLVIGLIGYALVRASRQPDSAHPSDGTDAALKLLRQRYASGEIDEDEFQSRKARLNG